MFVDWDAAGVELCDALAIDVGANYFVSCFGKTSPGNETHVTTTDNRKPQANPPEKSFEGTTLRAAKPQLLIVNDSNRGTKRFIESCCHRRLAPCISRERIAKLNA